MKEEKLDYKKFLKNILNLEEFFPLEEEYGDFTIIQTYFFTKTFKNNNFQNFNILNGDINSLSDKIHVRVTFSIENKSKEIIVNKNDLKKFFTFIKIYSCDKKNYINILILKKKNQDESNNILNRINKNINLKRTFQVNLKIQEFPLISYITINKFIFNI